MKGRSLVVLSLASCRNTILCPPWIFGIRAEGARAAIADARTRQIIKELNEVWHRWSVRAPATIVSRLYGRALGVGVPDLIENVLLAATEGEEFWLTKLP
jgi:hypothetical protein